MNPCPECQRPLSANTEACPHCGRPRANLLEAHLAEATRLEDTARLCALVMPLAALAAFCFTRITGSFVDALVAFGKGITGGAVGILIVVSYTLLILAFFAMPILVVGFIARAVVRCFQNR